MEGVLTKRGPDPEVRFGAPSYIVASSGPATTSPATRSLPRDPPPSTSGWTTFWDKGGWWRAVLVAVVYLALYLAGGQLVGALFGDQVDTDDLFATPQSVFFGLFLPLAVGAVVLIAFVASLRWFPALFARQPIRGRWWMWLAPVRRRRDRAAAARDRLRVVRRRGRRS